jgi:hypothetical protein
MRKLAYLLLFSFAWANHAFAQGNLAFQLTMQEGLKQYQAGRYFLAVDNLSRAASMDKTNSLVHYYLANALVYTGEHERAANEYYACYVLDPNSKVASYCLLALNAYKKPLDKRLIANEHATIIGANKKTIDNFVINADKTSSPDLSRTFTVIRRQVSFEKSKNKAIGESRSKVATGVGDEESRRISESAQLEIDRLYEPLIYPGPRVNPLLNNPELLKARADEIRRNAEEAQAIAKKKAQTRVESYKEWVKTKEAALEEVADNLENQLEGKKTKNGVQLQTVGTDLYVRYYGTANKNQAIPEVRPAVARIIGQKFNENDELEATSNLGNKNNLLKTNKQVSGKILEK